MVSIIIVCFKIFFCRILDVSLGTVKTVVLVKGKPYIAALIGFAETFIWFLIAKEALFFSMEGSKLFIAIAYAGGFASGTFIGAIIADKFFNDNVEVQIVTSSKNDNLVIAIRNAGYAITILDVNNSRFGKKKYILFSEIKVSQLKDFKALIYSLDKKAFLMVHETKYVYNGFFKQ
jgi:uncharacterized protein YebE (UPF0316 family)